jgi:hypothetical protein
MAVLLVVFFVMLAGLIRQGQRCLAAGCAMFISPGFPSMAVVIEGRSLSQVADLNLLPWSLAIGDTFIIPLAAGIAAHFYKYHALDKPWPLRGPRRLSESHWLRRFLRSIEPSWATWMILWFCVGLLVGVLFYFRIDGPAYELAGRTRALLSPSKLMHDFVVLPALWGAMFCACLPILRHRNGCGCLLAPRNKNWHRWALVACFIGWAVLVANDGQRGLDLTQLHPLWDAVNFRQVS